MEATAFTEPFNYWLITGVVSETEVEPLYRDAIRHPGPWMSYHNDCELKKRTTTQVFDISQGWAVLFAKLLSDFVFDLRVITGIDGPDGLLPDATLYGSGCHITDPGGALQPHLDFAVHPTSGLERRLSLVIFLNPEWRESWGGALELLDDAGSKIVRTIYPQPGLAVAWEASDISFHGTSQTSREAPPRVTAASYYLATPRGPITRKRALFVPRRSV